jgi:hypothetical protein
MLSWRRQVVEGYGRLDINAARIGLGSKALGLAKNRSGIRGDSDPQHDH